MQSFSYLRLSYALCLAGVVSLSGCSDDEPAPGGSIDAGLDAGTVDRVDGGAAPTGAVGNTGSQEPPAYLVIERVFTPDTRLYYASVLSEVPSSGVIDRKQAIEFQSADVELYDGKVFLRDRFDNSMTRYSVSSERKLVKEQQLSFQTLGLPTVNIHSAYVSPTSAWILNKQDWKLIEWNPTAMAITGKETSIEFANKAGIDGFINDPVQVDDKIFAPVFWEDSENYNIYPGTGLLVIDTKTPEKPEFFEDKRLAAGFKLSAADDGNLYVLGSVFAEYRMFGKAFGGGTIPPSGLLRVKRGEKTFDPSYSVDVDAIVKSPNIWGMHRIDDTHLLVQMWDPAVPVKATTQDELDNAFEYIYAIVDTEKKTWERVANLPKGGAGNSTDHRADGQLYIQVYVPNGQGEDGADAVVYAVSTTGVQEKFRVPSGDLWFVGRIR